jgi:8-oxo-dGTP pyrophosphatase MutT (NUDIX family)
MDFRGYVEMTKEQGAGVLPIAATGRILLGFRSAGGNQKTWASWGGSIEKGETPKETARRELEEETGFSGKIELIPFHVRETNSKIYHLFIGLVDEEFEPKLNEEHSKSKWLSFKKAKTYKPHHPSLKDLFKLKSKELKDFCNEQIARHTTKPNNGRGKGESS